MEETPTPLVQVPTPHPNPPAKDGPSGGQRGVFLLFGVMIGAAVVLLTLHFAQNPDKVAVKGPEPAQLQPKQTAPITPDPGLGGTKAPTGSTSITDPGKALPDPTKTPAKPPPSATHTANPSSGGSKPFDPFDGKMPPKEITGEIKPGGVATHVETVPDPATPPKALLVTIRLDVPNPEAAIKALQAIAAKDGGSAVQFDEAASRSEPEGAILSVPSTKAEDAQKQIAKVGSLVASDQWSGSATERVDRVERAANDRLSDLHVQRQELLIKYFEDAPQVKHVTEDADRITKCLGAFRSQKSDAKSVVIKIRFLSG